MYDYEHLYELIERTVNKYEQFEKKKNIYANNVALTYIEIHTIACIGEHSGINLTALAELRGITKSAASQMILRLRKKGLVTKERSENSEAEIRIRLTDIGEKAYLQHKEFHEHANSHFFKIIQTIPKESMDQIESIFNEFDRSLDEWLQG